MQTVPSSLRFELSAPHTSGRMDRSKALASVSALAAFGVGLAFTRVVWLELASAALFVVAFVLVGRALRRPPARGHLELRGERLVRVLDGREVTLLATTEPFGVTVLANRRRTRVLLAFTTREATRFVPVFLDGADEACRAELVALASTVPEGDALDVDGSSGGLDAEDALSLVRALERTSPAALSSLYLSTSRGDPLVLEGSEIQLGERSFDLRSPLDWRPFVFHESAGAVSTLYQATWIKQRGHELVLVAPMPLDVIPRSAKSLGGRSSEIRILAQTSETPPPRELRVAIDRMFMLPLRRALDMAPAPKRAPTAPPHGQGKAARSSTSDS